MPADPNRTETVAHSSAKHDPSSTEHDPLERLAADYVDRLRRGERPTMAEYQQQHPELASGIADLFPTIAALEGLREGDTVHEAGSPAQLGEFRILRELGRGGMGVVYLAEQPSLARRVALKVLPAAVAPDSSSRIRFQREARLSAGLSHPGITPVFAVGEGDGLPWFAMQLLHGVGLDQIIATLAAGASVSKENGSFAGLVRRMRDGVPVLKSREDWQNAAWLQRTLALLIAQAAEALHYAHQRGVLHRDVKPANLILDIDGRLWVNDFGLAKAVGEADLTSRDSITGTLLYMAPERFDGVTDRRSDVYSLGLVLYELLAKRRAFPQESHTQLIKAIMVDGVPPIRYHVPSLPQELAVIVDRACARQPERRYGDAASLARDLMTFADSQPSAPSAVAARPVANASDKGSSVMPLMKIAAIGLVGWLAWSWLLPGSLGEVAQQKSPLSAAPTAIPLSMTGTAEQGEKLPKTLILPETTPNTEPSSVVAPTPEYIPLLPERRPSSELLPPVIPLPRSPESSPPERIPPPSSRTTPEAGSHPPIPTPAPNHPIKPVTPPPPALERPRDLPPMLEPKDFNSRPGGGGPPPGGGGRPPGGGGPPPGGGGGPSGPRR
jgi:serine/threonine protein kinase